MSGLVVARTVAELDEALTRVRETGPVALVPTMGALHDGHGRLLEQASSTAPGLVVSIFVNPTQFGPGEDFDIYPRSFDDDLARCDKAGASVVFAPEVATMYPQGPDAAVVGVDPGPRGRVLEGAARPTHFRGVLTVVAKLFGLIRPDVAVFGEKDYQQLVLVRQMADALAMRVRIVGAPTVREADGLAMSSRNRFLTPDQHEQATALPRALRAGVAAAGAGAEAVLAEAHAVLESAGVQPDYLALTDDELGAAEPGREARLLVAARIGSTRLIDNHGLVLGS